MGILTNELSNDYKQSVRMINLSFEELPYHTLMEKLQDMESENFGEQTSLLNIKNP